MSNVTTVYAQTARTILENRNVATGLLAERGKYYGSNTLPANTLRDGDLIRITASGTIGTVAAEATFGIRVSANPGGVIGYQEPIPSGPLIAANQNFVRWNLFVLITVRDRALVCDGVWVIPRIGFYPLGIPSLANARVLREFLFNPAADVSFDIEGFIPGAPAVGKSIAVEQCGIEILPKPQRVIALDRGAMTSITPPGSFTATNVNTGTLTSSGVYTGAGGTLKAATASADLGTTKNTASVTFTYQGSEAAGGAAVGVRWKESAQQGIVAYNDSSGPSVVIFEMSTGWAYVQDANTGRLTLTPGNSYTLLLSDDGSTVTATIIDDVGVQTCDLATSLNTANTEFSFGWIGTIASYTFSAVVTDFTGTQSATVPTPMFSPDTGTYDSSQTVSIRTYPAGAAIYYTTDGSTPTTASTLYTGAISVSANATIKAMSVLPGWTDSAVAAATYGITIPTYWWKLDEGSGTTAVDSGDSDDGALTNGPTYVADAPSATGYSYSLSFDGTDDLVVLPGIALADDWTLVCRVKFAATGGNMIFVGQDEGAGEAVRWLFGMWDDDVTPAYGLNFHCNSGSNHYPIQYTGWTPSVDTWHSLAVTKYGDDYKLYIDGSLAHSNTDSGNVPVPDADLTFAGVDFSEGQGAWRFEGQLSDVRIYQETTLNATQIANIHTTNAP